MARKKKKTESPEIVAAPNSAEAMSPRALHWWMTANGLLSAITVFIIPTLVTFDIGNFVFGDAEAGKEIAAIFLACAWISLVALGGLFRLRIKLGAASIPIIALGAVYLIWLPFASYPYFAVKTVSVMISCVVMFFMFVTLDDVWKRRVMWSFIAGGVFALLMTIVMTNLPFIRKPREGGLTDTYGNPNLYAVYLLALLSPLVAALTKNRNRIMAAAPLAVIFVAALVEFYMSGSKGAILGVAVMGGTYIAMNDRSRRALFNSRGKIALMAVVILIGAFFLARGKLSPTMAYESLGERLTIWRPALWIIWENPFAGVGPGNFQFSAVDKIDDRMGSIAPGLRLADAHNDFLQIASETGLATGLIYLAIIIMFIYGGVVKRSDPLKSAALYSLLGVTAVGLATCVSIRAGTFFMMFFFGALAVDGEKYARVTIGARRGYVTAVIGALAVYFVVNWGVAEMSMKMRLAGIGHSIEAHDERRLELLSRLDRLETKNPYPKSPDRYYYRAKLEFMEGDYAKYLATTEKYLEEDPANPSTYIQMAYALLFNGRLEGAYYYARRAQGFYQRDQKNYATALYALNMALGEKDEADRSEIVVAAGEGGKDLTWQMKKNGLVR